MIESGKLYIIIRILIVFLNQHSKTVQSFTETSDLYLRNVVNELQSLNDIDSIPDSSSLTQIHNTSAYMIEPEIVDRKNSEIPKYTYQTQVNSRKPNYLKDVGVRDPVLLGFTSGELADMYKKAIGQGTPMKYNTFLNVVNKHLPQPNSYEFEDVSAPYVEDPQYTYYFYPLQSFRHQLNNFHPTRGGFDNKYESTSTITNSKKEMSSMNPILVGITSFLAMALFSIFSVFIYPRLMYLFHFPFVTATSRSAFRDYSEITSFIADSIDFYNEKKPLPMTSLRHVK